MFTFHSIGRPDLGLSTWQHKGEWNSTRNTRVWYLCFRAYMAYGLTLSIRWRLKSLFVRLSAYLYTFTQNDTYLTSANSAHQFIQSHLYNSITHSLQYKMYLTNCTYQDEPPFASDAGLYLEALTVLSQPANDEAMGQLLVSHELHILSLVLIHILF